MYGRWEKRFLRINEGDAVKKVSGKELKKRKIGVLAGGSSSEREVSLQSGACVHSALSKGGFNSVLIDVGNDLEQKLKKEKVELAFIALHGKHGEDGVVQGILEFLGCPYTGSNVMSSAMSLDKSVSKEIFEYHRIPTPSFEIVDRSWLSREGRQVFIKPPMVIKPVNGGSTIGISIVKEESDIASGIEEALKWSEKAVIERFVDGTLVAAGVLNGKPLPIVEIVPASGFYDYNAKYSAGDTAYYAPARISEEKALECQSVAVEAHKALRCSGATRADFIIDGDGTPFLLEINTIPGMTEKSLLPMAAGCAGISFLGLVEEILRDAVAIHGFRRRQDE